MTELYWISVLGKIEATLSAASAMGFITAAILVFLYLMMSVEKDNESIIRKTVKAGKCVVATTITAMCINAFIPNENQLYIIYGVGSVIDYVQDNDQAKTLPDNAVKAINKYLETLGNED